MLPNRNLRIEDLSLGFEKPEVLVQLVRASEGNARDFLNILYKCLSELGNNNFDDRTVTYFDVARAAHEWFDYDKYEMLSQSQKKHFDTLFSYIVHTLCNKVAVV